MKKRTIKAKARKMNGKIEISFTQKDSKPVLVSKEEAEKHEIGKDYNPSKKATVKKKAVTKKKVATKKETPKKVVAKKETPKKVVVKKEVTDK